MNRWKVCLAGLMVVMTHGQGTINFNTRFPAGGVDAPVTIAPFIDVGLGASFSAALYLWKEGAGTTLIPGSITTFRDGSMNPTLAKYINPLTVVVPGTEPGQRNLVVEMRVFPNWGGPESEGQFYIGRSGPLVIDTLGGGPDPTVNNNLPSSFTGFGLVPEASTVALGGLGVVILMAGRRKA